MKRIKMTKEDVNILVNLTELESLSNRLVYLIERDDEQELPGYEDWEEYKLNLRYTRDNEFILFYALKENNGTFTYHEVVIDVINEYPHYDNINYVSYDKCHEYYQMKYE